MDTTLSKWGNSLGVRIPQSIAKESGIGEGMSVRIEARKGRIVIEPIERPLDTLLQGITPENLHGSVETGSPQGDEIW